MATSVSFRHLALLAQVKPQDEGVWESLRATGTIVDPTPTLKDRLTRMRSGSLPSISLRKCASISARSPDATALGELTEDQRSVLPFLEKALQSAPWTTEGMRGVQDHRHPQRNRYARRVPCELRLVHGNRTWPEAGTHSLQLRSGRDDGTGSSSNGPVMQGEHQTRLLCCIIQHTIQKVSLMYLRHGRRVLSHM